MNRLKVKPKRPVCHKCNVKKSKEDNTPKRYLVYKNGYGWVCPNCGYEKPIKEWAGTAI